MDELSRSRRPDQKKATIYRSQVKSRRAKASGGRKFYGRQGGEQAGQCSISATAKSFRRTFTYSSLPFYLLDFHMSQALGQALLAVDTILERLQSLGADAQPDYSKVENSGVAKVAAEYFKQQDQSLKRQCKSTSPSQQCSM